MAIPFILRVLLSWLSILILASINGGLRQALLIPRLGERAGHVVSTLLLCAIILATTWVILPWVRPASVRHAWIMGGIWVVLTLAFEFLAGHYLFGNSWDRLLADYRLTQGRIWILVLITTSAAPALVYRLRLG